MVHYMNQLLGLATAFLVTLGPVTALAREWHAVDRSPAAGAYGLLQEPVIAGRSHTQSLMQESFRLHRTAEFAKDPFPVPPPQPSQRPQQPVAAAAAPHSPADAKHVAEETLERRQPQGKKSAEASLEVSLPPASAKASAAEPRPLDPPAKASTAAKPLLPKTDPVMRQEPHMAMPEPLPPPPRVGRSTQHAMLEADVSSGPTGQDTSAAVPAIKNTGGEGSLLSLLLGLLGRVLLLLFCVALILRFLVFRAATNCRRTPSRSTAGSGAPLLADAADVLRFLRFPWQCWGLFGKGEAGRAPPATDKSKPPASLSEGPFLCPELVVPAGKECKLVVPRLPLSSLGNGGKVSICDTHGVPVLRACFSFLACPGGARGPRLRDMKRLVLTSATGETAFAFCREAEATAAGGGRPSRLALYHRSEEPFGVLSADGFEAGSGYSIITQRGCTIYFRAGMKAGVMNATDDSGRLLAVVEPSGSSTLLRVGQLVDAGLITLTIIGITILEQGGQGSKGNAEPTTL